MIDPHGEYSAAFKGVGELFNVENLAMPYWLMNFEEHCEVFITSSGAERQRDMDILAKCLLAARAKNRAAEGMTKLTVDSPIPYAADRPHHRDRSTRWGSTRRPTRALHAPQDQDRRAEGRSALHFMFSGMLSPTAMTSFVSQDLPPARQGQADLDRRRLRRPVRHRLGGGAVLARLVFDYAIWSRNEVPRPLLLVCEEAHRYIPSDKTGGGQAVRKILERIAKEGRKYGVSPGPHHPAPVGSRRGRALAVRHDHRDAFQQRARPGLRQVGDAGRRARLPRRHPGASQPRVHRLRRGRLDPDPGPLRRPRARPPAGLVRPELLPLWRQTGDEEAMVSRVVRRWRSQGR
jgi:hypothetical protein